MASIPLTEAQIREGLQTLAGWEREGGKIVKLFRFDKYLEGTAFASAVGVLCEGLNHHPDLFIGYKKVQVSFSTHDAGNQITEKDLAAARAIEAFGFPKAK
ncbi:MAG: 4a-hydroxytetrahydrobiopterin dehydratase [Chloroflexi bacterium]|nr:4a-hydroxytetrahydrobiopterin dehydratase [Chloroflexota bacterium]